MKIHCHRPSLAAAFQVVSGVVPARTPRDILKNVKLLAADDAATLIGTNEEVGIRYTIPGVEIEQGGEALLPANRVVAILRELQEDGVNIETTEDVVEIKAGHSQFKLSAHDAAEFPPVPDFDESAYYTISGGAFRDAIRRTYFATDVESSRYALGGVLLDMEADKVTLAATDSRRLAVVTAMCSSNGVDNVENEAPVIPRDAMSLLERSITDDEEDVLIAVHANDVLVKAAACTIYARLVDGRFPRYRDVIPKDPKSTIDLLVGPFYAAVRQAQVVTNDDSRGVDFTFNEGTLTLSSLAADVGSSKIETPIPYDGDELTITFDPRFVADFLRVLEPEDQVHLSLIDKDSAAVFRSGSDYTYVIMPLSKNDK